MTSCGGAAGAGNRTVELGDLSLKKGLANLLALSLSVTSLPAQDRSREILNANYDPGVILIDVAMDRAAVVFEIRVAAFKTAIASHGALFSQVCLRRCED